MDSAVFACHLDDLEVGRSRFGPTATVDRTTALAGTQVRPLPGGARIVELWSGPEHLTLTASGDIDASDQHAVIDLVTDGILRGARRVRFDGSRVTFVDVAVLRSLLRCRRFLARSGGTLTVTGMRSPFDLVWLLLDAEASRQDSSLVDDPRGGLIGASVATGMACA